MSLRNTFSKIGLLSLLALGSAPSLALQVQKLSPQGVVEEAHQVVLRTDQDAVRFGDPQAPAPAEITCSDPAFNAGSGHWNNAREWAWEFDRPLPAGTSCTVRLRREFQSPTKEALKGAKEGKSYQFQIAGPRVEERWPRSYEAIDEAQVFVLRLNGPATRESLLEYSYCRSPELGERVPLRWVEGEQAQAIVQSLRLEQDYAERPEQFALITCQRRWTAGSQMQLVYGAGVATPGGQKNHKAQVLDYEVRRAFSAQMSCERERPSAGCLPIRPISLEFSAPVERSLAAQVRLTGEGHSQAPVLDDDSNLITSLHFAPPFTAQAQLRIELPEQLKDDAGRPLSNAANYPLMVRVGEEPGLAKFASERFGVLERYAEGSDGTALLPLTVRNIEGMHQTDQAQGAQLRSLVLDDEADIIHWWSLLAEYHSGSVNRERAGQDTTAPLPPPGPKEKDPETGDEHAVTEVEEDYLSTRSISLLKDRPKVEQVLLPQPKTGDPRPFEVVAVPLTRSGFHVLEIDSPRLGAALMDDRLGPQRRMYVRTSALVTDLAVHSKIGKEGSLAWVTRLSSGQPVANAQVKVFDCLGRLHAEGRSDAQGRVPLPGKINLDAPHCDYNDKNYASYQSGEWFISARTADDMAFVWSDWQKGIEPWRFNLPRGWSGEPALIAHTVLDRPLLRTGETVSMKHFVRQEVAAGLAMPPVWPREAVITHLGSGQEERLPLSWGNVNSPNSSSRSASHSWAIPRAAKLGQYRITLEGEDKEGNRIYLPSGEFRVEAFRLPVLQGSITPAAPAPLMAAAALPVQMHLQYLDGGSAAGQEVQVSAQLQSEHVYFERWQAFSFSTPRAEEEERTPRLLLDKQAMTLNAQGQGQLQLPAIEAKRPQRLLLEASFADPSGEIHTLSSRQTVWPTSLLPAIALDGWADDQKAYRFKVLAVDTQGQPQAKVAMTVQATRTTTTSTRKRLVGGFYSYDNHEQQHPMGKVCSGKTDSQGLLECSVQLKDAGRVTFTAQLKDRQGRVAEAADSVWVSQGGQQWFGGEDHDRMDLLPEKTSYRPGETARLQVRMPFRQATALVTIEREGILDSQVVQLQGDKPMLELPLQEGWGPNVYVSVLALRGRLEDVPWYSFFTWGYRSPGQWWSRFRLQGQDYVAPTALVDLSKPTFRLGVAELRVQDPSQQLQVKLSTDQERYQVRDKAQVQIEVRLPNGEPAAHADVALAAVDQALLELLPNHSWQLGEGLWRRRNWYVSTATAQSEVVGKRHFGLKAAAPGGGGGSSELAQRELFDTLLLWQPQVRLDEQGRAQVELPLNDSLSRFTIAVIAANGTGQFGTGQTSISTTQDLQIISGLPPVVREGDQFTALFTLRNTTEQAMRVELQARVSSGITLDAQTVELPAGQAQELRWQVQVPQALAHAAQGQLHWQVQAKASQGQAQDSIRLHQRLLPALPLAVQQATLLQVDSHWQQALQWPAQALPGKGGLRLSFSPRLADPEQGVPGLRDWWEKYPFTCLEQTTSRAVGMNDAAQWQDLMGQLPNYLDEDGLALYFPPMGSRKPQGSDTLTAHLLTLSHYMSKLDPRFTLPPAQREQMLQGLHRFVTGKLERKHWSPRQDLAQRKLSAIAALTLHGQASADMLDSIDIDLATWPTHSLLDWVEVLPLLPQAQREQRQAQAWQALRNRLSYAGTQLGFSTEAQDHWWWLMQGPSLNAARLLLLTLGQSDWDDERPRIVTGLLARQIDGHWGSTTANLWAGLALRGFSQRYEQDSVSGHTNSLLHASSQSVDWSQLSDQARLPNQPAAAANQARLLPTGSSAVDAPLPPGQLFLPWGDSPQGELSIQHRGTGKPWVAVQVLAAVPRSQPVNAGYRLRKTVTPLQQAQMDKLQRGDLVRVRLEVQANADMTWVALSDPIPAGASILGSGLGRDSAIATQGEDSPSGFGPIFVERDQDSYRAYWSYLPQGSAAVEYTLRLNNPGEFALPPSRIEALYAPEVFGEVPNSTWRVGGGQ